MYNVKHLSRDAVTQSLAIQTNSMISGQMPHIAIGQFGRPSYGLVSSVSRKQTSPSISCRIIVVFVVVFLTLMILVQHVEVPNRSFYGFGERNDFLILIFSFKLHVISQFWLKPSWHPLRSRGDWRWMLRAYPWVLRLYSSLTIQPLTKDPFIEAGHPIEPGISMSTSSLTRTTWWQVVDCES